MNSVLKHIATLVLMFSLVSLCSANYRESNGMVVVDGYAIELGTATQTLKSEDAHVVYGWSDGEKEIEPGFLCVGVFDGHGKKDGGRVARKAANAPGTEKGADLISMILLEKSKLVDGDTFADAIARGFLAFDESVKNIHEVGTTAVLVFVVGGKVYIAYVGDSRCVVRTSAGKILATKDHTLNNAQEFERVGEDKVFYNKNGDRRIAAGKHTLAMSRSLGDYYMDDDGNVVKPAGLFAEPTIHEFPLDGYEMTVASDCLWDNFRSDVVATYVTEALKSEKTAQAVAQAVVHESYEHDKMERDAWPHDDISVTVMRFTTR